MLEWTIFKMKIKQQISPLLLPLQELANKHGFAKEAELALQIHHSFQLRLPLVGTFSAGKSSLLNSLLGEKLLGVQVTPETCLPTEIFYAEQETITLVNQQGPVASVSRQQLQEQDFATIASDEDHWIEIGLPNSVLADLSDLILVDMPGWESGITAHNQAIDSYVERSGAYCLVINAKDGTVRQSIQDVLTELKLFNKPVILLVSKSDTCEPAALAEITQEITQSVSDVLAAPPLQVLAISSRKKKVDGVLKAFMLVSQQSHQIYSAMVYPELERLFQSIESKLTILINEENLTLEQVQLACAQVPQELIALKQKLAEVELQIDEIVPMCIKNANMNLKNALVSQVSTLASAVLRGNNVDHQVGSALRQGYLSAVEQDFKPRISQRLKMLPHINEADIASINISSTFELTDSSQNSTVLSTVISQVLTKLVTLVPVLKPFEPIINVLAGIFTSQAEKKIQQGQQQEEAKQHVLNSLIPEVLCQAEPIITQSFASIAQQIKQALNDTTEEKSQEKQHALKTLQEELADINQSDQMLREQYRQDLIQLQEVKAAMKEVLAG